MPKSLRYGLIILVILGVLFLTAYIFRDSLTGWYHDIITCHEFSAGSDIDGGDGGGSPFQ